MCLHHTIFYEAAVRIAIMQPYFFPYLGYFQLIHAVDAFVFLDDVAFIKKGWINRNRLAFNGKITWFTVPLSGQSQHTLIRDIRVARKELLPWQRKFIRSLWHFYGKSPFYQTTAQLVEEVLSHESESMADLAKAAIAACCRLLGITSRLIDSSSAFPARGLCGEERLVDLCKQAGATEYVNPSGGITLYTKETFARHGIGLHFLCSNGIEYQAGGVRHGMEFSILDALMWYGPERLAGNLLRQYRLC